MSRLGRIILWGSVAVVAYDVFASALSLLLGFQYSNASAGSLVIYIAVGYFAARARSIDSAVGVGVVLGTVDATIGWAASWALGPGRLPSGTITLNGWFFTAMVVVGVASFFTGVGGLVGGRTKRSNGAAA